jgi:hypothetical protein
MKVRSQWNRHWKRELALKEFDQKISFFRLGYFGNRPLRADINLVYFLKSSLRKGDRVLPAGRIRPWIVNNRGNRRPLDSCRNVLLPVAFSGFISGK